MCCSSRAINQTSYWKSTWTASRQLIKDAGHGCRARLREASILFSHAESRFLTLWDGEIRGTVGICSPPEPRGEEPSVVAAWSEGRCFDCVSSPLAPPFSTFRPVKQTSSSAEVKPSPETPCYIFVLRDKHTSGGSDIDEFVGFLLFVCSEEVSGACGDQTTLEDLVRIYLVFLFFYLILSYIPTFYTLARMSKVC